MSQPYIGEIRLFGGNFAPAGWMFCHGQMVPIADYDTLFNLIGTTYGGDGESTFGLPDLRGRIPLHRGQRPGGSSYVLGQMGGVEAVTLTTQQIPSHSHPAMASASIASSASAQDGIPASWPDAPYRGPDGVTAPVALAPDSVGASGGGQPHDNMPPYLGLTFIISMYGVYPTPN